MKRSTNFSSIALSLLLLPTACGDQNPGPADDQTPQAVSPPAPEPLERPVEPAGETDSDSPQPETEPTAQEEVEEKTAKEPELEKVAAPHPGPWIWITRTSAAIYATPKRNAKQKLGYVKRGGKLGILEGKTDGENCPKGWFKVASGGYICSHVGTTNKNDKGVKFRPSQPDVEAILPYTYARNAKNGTPAYKTIPTREQTLQYEPYLPEAIKARELKELAREEDLAQMREAGLEVEAGAKPAIPTQNVKVPGADKKGEGQTTPKIAANTIAGEQAPAGQASAAAELVLEEQAAQEEQQEEEKKIPIWEREENLNEVTHEELRSEADAILAQRMMKGFYVAIDKTFKWDGRSWYKTTKGLVTPSERFWQTKGSDFKGVELDREAITLPVGWVFGGRKTAPTYEIDTETNKRKPKGKKDKFELVELRYQYHRIGKLDYFQMKDGDWIRDRHIRMTTPGKRPSEVGPNERWVDVDISEQTLVVFEGDKPVYATLISSGKESKIKDKDHSTPRGMWRVREKHMVSTMDGDGSAAGDLPYSIEDVPYIMYFHKSYATHGAFWHRNYGSQMSHGCINMAPLDAKWVFFYADPQLPPGFHGNWSNPEDLGSMIVVHD